MWHLPFLHNNKIGLVLSGGGARGFFHVGVIKALQELRVTINEIAGTSIGAIVGAMWATNSKIDIEKKSKEVKLLDVIRIIRESKKNNIDEVKNYLKTFVPAERFEDLHIKLTINAVDINNRKEVVFNKGNLYPALIASLSVPGIFNPIEYRDSYLVDGGLVNNLPISLIGTSSRIIVSDIGAPVKKIHSKSSTLDVLYSSMVLMQQIRSVETLNNVRDKNIIYLSLENSDVALLDFRKKHFQKLIDAGYHAVMTKKKMIL